MAHSFVINSTRSKVVIGVACVPGLAFLVGVYALIAQGGLWIGAAIALGFVGFVYAMGIGALARRLGVRVEVDELGIRTIDRGVTRAIAWHDAITVTVERTSLQRGASLFDVRVDDGRGTTIEARVPAYMGRVIDPGAREALVLVEREARVPLAAREARRHEGARRAAPVEIVRGTFSSFPRTAWISLAFALLLPVPALKLLVVDHFTGALAPCLAGSAGFLLYVAFAWSWVGELELDERELRGRRRLGGRFTIARHTITLVERIGSNENDSLGVALVLTDGTTRRLPRLAPIAMRDRLLAIAPSR